jgi:polyphosphate glucokinase
MSSPAAGKREARARVVLAVDVGGSHVKLLASDQNEPRRFESGAQLTPERMLEGIRANTDDWPFDVVSLGLPTPVHGGKPIAEPLNLAEGWVNFDYDAAFGKPTIVVNDAVMQAIGSYEAGRMLFLGLGTGLGSALIVDGVVEPLELGHLPFRNGTFEDYVTKRARKKRGAKKWRRGVFGAIEQLTTAIDAADVVIGGGEADELDELPPGCRRGSNANAFVGGFRLWEHDWIRRTQTGAGDVAG